MFEISVAIIAKNEESVLKRLLECVKNFAEEIIVVDTGSTDKTVEIALEYTDKVYYFSWRSDFAAARNYAFSFATKEYIMWLDADDVISEENTKKINELKRGEKFDTYMLKYDIQFDCAGNPVFSYYRERLVKNCSSAKWLGAVHEVIAPFGRIKYTDISVWHKKAAPSESGRNLKIYRKLLKSGYAFNSRELYYYSRELYYNGFYRKAEASFIKAIKSDLSMPDKRECYIMLADLLLKSKKYKLALAYLFEGLKVVLPTEEYMCKIAQVLLYVDNLQLSAVFYKNALENRYDKNGFYKKDYGDIIPALSLCRIYYLLGDLEKSVKYNKIAKSFSPNDERVLYNERFFSEQANKKM